MSSNPMTSPIIILGSSRSNGATYKAIKNIIADHPETPIIDLNAYNISPYDYEHSNKNDDFLLLMERIVGHNPIVLATPVYWYTMSAQMKTFIDRFSDLLAIAKDTGRKLRGKSVYVINTFSESIPEGFEAAFSQTCDYLGMKYLGCSYINSDNLLEFQERNVEEIKKAVTNIFGL